MPREPRSPVLQMPRRIHAFMQNADHVHPVLPGAVIHHMAFNRLAPVAWANVVAGRRGKWRLHKHFKARIQLIDVAFRLGYTPALGGVAPNVLQIAQCRRCQAKLSHA